MENTSPEISQEPELVPLVCPRCTTEIAKEPWPQVCPKCQNPLDLEAQFAYCRGHNAFTIGQDLLMAAYRSKRKSRLPPPDEVEGLNCYMQAYSSLQQAFHGELAESQRQLALRMMASIVQVFQHNTMVSPLEASYWSTLLVEMNAQQEKGSLQEKLAQKDLGLIGIPLRWRWRIRLKQLEEALIALDRKSRLLERNIGFTERLRIRKPS